MNVFSAIRPSAEWLHLGNYLGAIKQWVELQEEADNMIVGIVDHHAITTDFNPAALNTYTMGMIRDFLTAGIDPEQSSIIVQSWVPEHTELAWILSALTPLSWFEKVPTYKEKADQEKTVTLGLLSYPALMAADILLYNSTHVPVGEDQIPHIELTNNIVKRLNHHYETDLNEVEAIVPETGARIMSLQDPTKKMSKTDDGGIALWEPEDDIRKKVKKAVTDSENDVRYDPEKKAGVSNLLTIVALLTDRTVDDVAADYSGSGYKEFKEDVAEIIVDALRPFRERKVELDAPFEEIVAKGVKHVRPTAQNTLSTIKEQLGYTNSNAV